MVPLRNSAEVLMNVLNSRTTRKLSRTDGGKFGQGRLHRRAERTRCFADDRGYEAQFYVADQARKMLPKEVIYEARQHKRYPNIFPQMLCTTFSRVTIQVGILVDRAKLNCALLVLQLHPVHRAVPNRAKEIEQVLVVESHAQRRTRVRDVYSFMCVSVFAT